MDLSLTGSQIASQKRRPNSAGRSRPGFGGSSKPSSDAGRPQSSTSVRQDSSLKPRLSAGGDRRVGLTNGYLSGTDGAGGARSKHRRAASNNSESLSHHSSGSAASSPRRPPIKSPAHNSNDDFLALFNSNHKPVIHKPMKSVKAANKKPCDTIPSSRAFPIPSSVRSSSTIDCLQLSIDHYDSPEIQMHYDSPPIPQQLNSHVNSEHRHPAKMAATFTTTNILRDSQTNLKNSNQNPSGHMTSHNNQNELLSRRPASPLRTSSHNALQHSPRENSTAQSSTLQKSTSSHNALQKSSLFRKFPTPVNQSIAEDYITSVNGAARTIQKWYRKHLQARKAGEDQLRRLLGEKKQQREQELLHQNSLVKDDLRMMNDKKKRREEKARVARQEAIKELQRKRQQKEHDIKKMAEDEIKFLQKNGKISKTPAVKSRTRGGSTGTGRLSKVRSTARSVQGTSSNVMGDEGLDKHYTPVAGDRSATASSVGRRVDEIFEKSTTHRTQTTEENAETDVDSEIRTKTTLTDLLDTLKLLEEPVGGSTPREEPKKKKVPTATLR